jgi:hypothetical protein
MLTVPEDVIIWHRHQAFEGVHKDAKPLEAYPNGAWLAIELLFVDKFLCLHQTDKVVWKLVEHSDQEQKQWRC